MPTTTGARSEESERGRPHPGYPPLIQCVTHVYARSVAHVCARRPLATFPTPLRPGTGALRNDA